MLNQDQLEHQRLDILRSMGSITRMRRGTINKQFFDRKNSDGFPVRLGPYFLFSRTEKRQSFSKRLARGEVERFREETENCRRFKELVTQYILVCEGLAASAGLSRPTLGRPWADCAADKTPAEVKKPSKQSSTPRSSRRSKR